MFFILDNIKSHLQCLNFNFEQITDSIIHPMYYYQIELNTMKTDYI